MIMIIIVYFFNLLQFRSVNGYNILQIYRIAASTLVPLSLSPIGNINEALRAILRNPESITCTLDEQNSDEIHSSCQLLDDVVRVRANRLFTIHQNWGGSASTGASIWQGANMATWFLEHKYGSAQLQGKNLIELGAGVGFTSLVAHSLGADQVVITDGNEDVLKLADQNIDANVDSNGKSRIKTAQLRWSTEDERRFTSTRWDYILASDVTYRKASWSDLIGTIARLSGPNTKTILSMEPRNIGEVEGVLSEATNQGLSYTEQWLPVDKEKTQCGMTCARLFILTKSPLVEDEGVNKL